MPSGRRLLARVYAVLPRPVQAAAARAYARRKARRLRHLRTPTAVILYVTQRCNARCAHCFYWKEIDAAAPELSLDELRKLAASFRHPVCLSITGGEPFLRKDLYDVVEAFSALNRCREVAFATNGMLTARVTDTCRQVLDRLDVDLVGVQVSLDGLEHTHNAIRAVPAFAPAMETVRRLADLAKEVPRFGVQVSCCIQKRNIAELRDFVEFLLPLRVPLRFAVVRGKSFGTWNVPEDSSSEFNPRDPESPLVPLSELEDFFAWLRKRNAESDFKFWSPIQQARIGLTLGMLREQQKSIPCYAGSIDGVIYANGDVALCELTRPVGNLRDFDMDVEKLWRSAGADAMRRKTRTCFCIHGCNLVTGLLFRPEHIREAILQKAT